MIPEDKNEKVLNLLAEAWNAYLEARPECKTKFVVGSSNRFAAEAKAISGIIDDDLQDFRKAIHDAQRIVMARAYRNLKPEQHNHVDMPPSPPDRDSPFP